MCYYLSVTLPFILYVRKNSLCFVVKYCVLQYIELDIHCCYCVVVTTQNPLIDLDFLDFLTHTLIYENDYSNLFEFVTLE